MTMRENCKPSSRSGMKDEVVEVIRSPEAPHLIGKRGVVCHKEGKRIQVRIGDGYTDFLKGDVKVVKDP